MSKAKGELLLYTVCDVFRFLLSPDPMPDPTAPAHAVLIGCTPTRIIADHTHITRPASLPHKYIS